MRPRANRDTKRMTRYFFHLRTTDGVEVTDDDGDDLPDDAAAEAHAIEAIKQLVKGSSLDWAACSFEVHDEENRHVMTVWFKDAALRPVRISHGPRSESAQA